MCKTDKNKQLLGPKWKTVKCEVSDKDFWECQYRVCIVNHNTKYQISSQPYIRMDDMK